MGINLLPQVNIKEKKKIAFKTGLYVSAGIWLALVIVITAVFYFVKGLATTKLETEKANRRKVIQELRSMSAPIENYYNIGYKSLVLTYVGKKKYKPSVVVKYIDNQIRGRGVVKSYALDATGTIGIAITARDYTNAVHIWHSLLENEKIIEELNLNSFSRTEAGNVSFSLKGKLNLQELYKSYADNKQ